MLTYKERKAVTEYVDREVTVRIPTDWGMFSYQGNLSITKKATALYKKVDAAMNMESESKRRTAIINAVLAYLRSFRKLYNSKTMSEAGDTMVRDCVASFMDEMLKVADLEHLSDDLWEDPRGWPE